MTTPEPREDHELAALEREVAELIEMARRSTSDSVEPREHWVARKLRLIADEALRRPSLVAESTPSIRDAVADGEGVERVATELFGGVARKVLELVSLVASERVALDADDPRLTKFCDDMPGGEDTFNLACDAGYIDQFLTDDDAFEVRLLDKGRALSALRALKSTPTDATAVEAEREACAKVCERLAARPCNGDYELATASRALEEAASAIRARTKES